MGCTPSLNTGLQVWLPFDESTGTGAIDASGQGYKGDLSATSASWQPTGGVNRGALSLPSGGSLFVPWYWQPGSFTVSWWVNPSQYASYGQALSALMPYAGGGWGGFLFYADATGALHVGTDSYTQLTVAPGSLSLNTWQHFAFTFTPNGSTGTGQLYRNGQVVATKAGMSLPQPWNGFKAGAVASTSLAFLGLLDDLRLYNRALTDQEVLQVSQCRATPTPLSLCPPLRVATSGDVTVAQGGSTAVQATPSVAGTMLTFDGLDDNLEITNRDGDPRVVSKGYATVNNFTFEAWVLPTTTHKIDPVMTQYAGLSGGQRWAFNPVHGALYYGDDHATTGLSVGTNGISVYELSGDYYPAVLVWQSPTPLTSWTHVAVVYTNRQPSLYVNGQLVMQATVQVHDGNGNVVSKSYVHPSPNLGGGTYQGSIDEVRVWNVARSGADILATKNNVVTSAPPTLIGNWRFDEGTGRVARDLTSNYNDGFLKGGGNPPGPNGNGPAWVPSTAPLTGVNTDPALTLRWTPTAGLSAATGASLTATPASTTAYVAQATTACGATAQGRLTVTVLPSVPAPTVNLPVTCTPTLGGSAPASRAGATDVVNYVRTYTARQVFTDPATLTAAGVAGVQVKTEYLDGLGRSVQTVLRQESPLGRDLVQPMAYDALGRQAREYLPYVSGGTSSGSYHPDALKEQDDFYRTTNVAGPGLTFDNVSRTGFAYGEKQFEASPLDRVTAQTSPGENWVSHPVNWLERPNTAADAVARFTAAYDAATTLTYQNSYAAGELWLSETTDEDQRHVRTFKDKQGQVVAKLVEASVPVGTWLTTYYVYDDFARLRAVLPPKATALLTANSWNLTAPEVTRLLFRYRYDARGRQLAKQLPDQDGEQQVVYDQLDRPILTQDAQQRTRQEWSWIKYDALGRAILAGLTTRAATADQLQQQADQLSAAATVQQAEQRTTTAPHYYSTTQSYPRLDQDGFSASQVLTVNYYDDYNFDNAGAQVDVPYYSGGNSYLTSPPQPDYRVIGLVTSTRTRVLGVAAGTIGEWLTSTTFYDDRGRAVQVQNTNARGGNDIRTSQLDFTGKVEKLHAIHTAPNTNISSIGVGETYSYDAVGRLLEVRQQILQEEAAPTLVARHTYNELGQLVRKTLSPNTALQQQVDYTYNPRGWLTGLNEDLVTGMTPASTSTDLWGLRLSYDCGFQVPQYNGNISGQQWRSKADGVARAYGYGYDKTNRLTRGDYVAQTAAGTWSNERQNYGMGMNYDANGNIQRLVRNGLVASATHTLPNQFGRVDQLAYTYQGNRLLAVDDTITGNALAHTTAYNGAQTSLAGDFLEKTSYRQTGQVEYGYDANGSMIRDSNKGLTQVHYNHLNLPDLVKFTDQDYIEFRYSATGQKVAKRVFQTGKPVVQTDYLNGYQYESDTLRFFPHAEGRVLRFVSPTSGQRSYQREYTLKDHLGNLRLAYRLGTKAQYTATLETTPASRATLEEQQWDQQSLVSTRTQVNALVARTGSFVARLNSASGKPIGPLKLLPVQKGDTVTVTAPGYYPQAVAGNSSYAFSLLSFVAQQLRLSPPPPVPAGEASKPLRPLPFLSVGLAVVPTLPPVSGGVPKGYVRLLTFNQDSVLLSSQTRQLSSLAGTGYEELKLSVVAPSCGYIEAYVGNESEVDVYFDDVTLDYHPGLQVQEIQYDPFGLSLAGLNFAAAGIKSLNQYQLNSKEKQEELGVNWTDYGARMYDAQLGRWYAVDPLADFSRRWSPYAYAYNNPIRFIDPDGMQAFEANAHFNIHDDDHELGGNRFFGMDSFDKSGVKLKDIKTYYYADGPGKGGKGGKDSKHKRDYENDDHDEEYNRKPKKQDPNRERYTRHPLDDKQIRQLEDEFDWDHSQKDGGSRKDMFQDEHGNVWERRKEGQPGSDGPGEEIGYNIRTGKRYMPDYKSVVIPSAANTVGTLTAAYLLYKILVAAATWECLGCGVLVTP